MSPGLFGVDVPAGFRYVEQFLSAEDEAALRIQEKTKIGEYLVANSIGGVVALAQMGVVDIHT